MRCENCGAAVADDAATCPECGESLSPAAAAHPAASAPLKVPGAKGFTRPAWLIPVIAVVVLVAILAGVFFLLVPKLTALGGPEGAVQRMLQAYAVYDGAGMLDNATHASVTTSDVAAFEKQVAAAKTAANDAPNLKNLQIVSTEYPDPKDKNTAVVKVSGEWLTDPAKGTYTQRTETVTVVFRDGKWQVVLFQ
jgi:zinc-ribbon domain